MWSRSTKQRRNAMRRRKNYAIKATDPSAVWCRSTPGYYFAAPLIVSAPSWSGRISLFIEAPKEQ